MLACLVVVPGAVGDLLMSAAMKKHGEIVEWNPSAVLSLAVTLGRDYYVLVGIFAMAVSFFALMALLSAAALSFAVPITACSYVLDTALAKYLLNEHINWQRWAGAALVAAGVALLST